MQMDKNKPVHLRQEVWWQGNFLSWQTKRLRMHLRKESNMTATPKLRWVKRIVSMGNEFECYENILQQWWNDSVGQDDCGGEWRDVPIEEEAT
jgi:hypothetical protein